MSAIKDGGQAFPLFPPPSETGDNILPIQYGMTMRQYYKAAALQGHLANHKTTEHPSFDRAGLAGECGSIADAILAEDEAHAIAGHYTAAGGPEK